MTHEHQIMLNRREPPYFDNAPCRIEETCHQSYRLLFPYEEEVLTEGLWWIIDRRNGRWKTLGSGITDPEDEHSSRANTPRTSICSSPSSGLARTPQMSVKKMDTMVAQLDAIVTLPSSPIYGESSMPYEASAKECCNGQQSETAEERESNTNSRNLRASQDPDQKRPSDMPIIIPWREKRFFDSFCINGDLCKVKALLDASSQPRRLLEETEYEEDKPSIIKACEAGQFEMVDFMVSQEVNIDAPDPLGNTALMRAVYYGYGATAKSLIQAGASLTACNNKGESVVDVARRGLALQQALNSTERRSQRSLNPSVPDLWSRQDLAQKARNIEILDDIVELYEFRQSAVYASVALLELQRAGFPATKKFSGVKRACANAQAIGELMRENFNTPVSSQCKTIACLTRGDTLPPTFAVSGWPCALYPPEDHQHINWEDKIFQLVDALGHPLPRSRKDFGRDGRYFACHAEKHLLTHLIWNHTTTLGDADELGELCTVEPRSLSKLRADIFIYQPASAKPAVCESCLIFCDEISQEFGLRLRLWAVGEKATYLHRRWPMGSLHL